MPAGGRPEDRPADDLAPAGAQPGRGAPACGGPRRSHGPGRAMPCVPDAHRARDVRGLREPPAGPVPDLRGGEPRRRGPDRDRHGLPGGLLRADGEPVAARRNRPPGSSDSSSSRNVSPRGRSRSSSSRPARPPRGRRPPTISPRWRASMRSPRPGSPRECPSGETSSSSTPGPSPMPSPGGARSCSRALVGGNRTVRAALIPPRATGARAAAQRRMSSTICR